jgi:hypothetical protein
MRKTSGHIEQWRKDLPKVKALTPYGLARTSVRFKLVPTNPESERLSSALYEWALRTGLFPPESAEHLRSTRMGYLVYWHAPLASSEVRWLIATFHLWITSVDDFCVEVGAPLDELQQACDEVIRTGKTTGSSTPQSSFFVELREKLIANRCEGLLPQIAEQVDASFEAWKQEQGYLAEGSLPTLAEYLELRVGITGLYSPVLVQRCEKGLLLPEKRFCDRLDRLARLINVIVALNGDTMGVQKDINDDCPMNVIPVLALDFGVDIATAYLMGIELLDIYKQIFDALVVDICHRPFPEPETAAQARIMALWLDGFHTWHVTGKRHGGEEARDALLNELNALGNGQQGALARAVRDRLGKPTGAAAAEDAPLGVASLGTSAVRLAASLSEAEMLKQWASSLLGWSTPIDSPKTKTDAAAPFTEIKPTGIGHGAAQLRESLAVAAVSPGAPAIVEFKPTGIGNAAASIAASTTSTSQGKGPGPSNDAPGATPPIPGFTGLGTSAATLQALAPKTPEAALSSSQ